MWEIRIAPEYRSVGRWIDPYGRAFLALRKRRGEGPRYLFVPMG